MKLSPLFFLGLPALAAGYEVACEYPTTMPDPLVARAHLHQFSGSYLMYSKVETPVVIHIASLSSLCQINCLAYHDTTVLDVLTKQRPLGGDIPEEYHNAWSRMLCIAQCFDLISSEAGQPEFYTPFWEKWGLTGLMKRDNGAGIAILAAQGGTDQPLKDYLASHDYHPYYVAQVVASEILLHVLDDGWNALGEWTYDTETGEAVKCTANCQNYKDTTGYFPKNHPTGKPELNGTKYEVTGTDMYWQPLVDNDGKGFFMAQEHVTPHIGYTAKMKLYDSVDDIPVTPPPEYNFYEEALKVVDRLKDASGDDLKKQKIAFFDNKLLVLNTVENHVKQQFSEKYSFEEELLYIEGMSAGEHDATVMAWREKVRHDLVRPTTVIHRWGSDTLNTFSGDKTADGPVDIAARDFHAFQRVMPHSEYPSGSGCICTAYAEFTDAFTMGYYNETISNVPFGEGEGSTGEGYGCDPTMDPPLFVQLGCNDSFVIPDMPGLIEECGQSRLWAGFHFTAAVTESLVLCKGIGYKAYDHVQEVRNGSTLGQKFYKGDPRPTCSTGDVVVSKDATSAATAAAHLSVILPLLAFFTM